MSWICFAGFPSTPSETVGYLLAYVFATIGHTSICVFGINHFLGYPFPKWFMRPVRHANTLLGVFGPVLIGWCFWLGWSYFAASWWGWCIIGYLALCLLMGMVIAPVSHVLYWQRRRKPVALSSNHSEVLDVVEQLGYKPLGTGKKRILAQLPGNEIFRVEFNEKHIALPSLPEAWEGLSILHLTDLHFRGVPDKEFFRKVLEHCQRWKPDIVAITGDITDSFQHHRWILPILGRLHWKEHAFAILGNHDDLYQPEVSRRRLKKLGMEVLGNRWTQVTVRGLPMIAVGHEGPWIPPVPDLTDCPEGIFRLCLSHTPDNIGWAKRHHIDLMLSGHNHGGQIRFPFLGSVFVPSKSGRRYDCGSFHEPPTFLHVSRGLSGQYPVRYNCKPEVTFLVLHKGY